MKKIIKKNQVIITALAIMIAVAGYLNFTSDKQVLNTTVEDMESEGASGNSDDEMISASVSDTVEGTDYAAKETEEIQVEDVSGETLASQSEEITMEEGAMEENTGEDVAQASLDPNGDPIDSDRVGETVLTSAAVSLSQAKLNREQTRSKAKEMLLEIINNETLTEDAKAEAVEKMITMTERMEKENAAETQLAAKGFPDSIVSISEDSIDVTLSVSELTDVERTQIEDIIMRKTGCEINQIVITTTN